MRIDVWNLPGLIYVKSNGDPRLVGFSIISDYPLTGSISVPLDSDAEAKIENISSHITAKDDLDKILQWVLMYKNEIKNSSAGKTIIVKRKF